MKTTLVSLAAVLCGGYYLHNQSQQAPAHHQAPAGTYYLREPYSNQTQSGLVNWAPGQELRADPNARYSADAVTLTDGLYSVEVPMSLLTQDIEDAAFLREKELLRRTEFQANATQILQVREENARLEMELARQRTDFVQRTQWAAQERERLANLSRVGNGTFHSTALDEPGARPGRLVAPPGGTGYAYGRVVSTVHPPAAGTVIGSSQAARPTQVMRPAAPVGTGH